MTMKKSCVLVIDDDPTILKMFHYYFKNSPFRCITCDPVEGEKILRTHHTDICRVFLDFHMTPVDGDEFFWNNRNILVKNHIPVHLMTGDYEHPRVRALTEHGIASIIEKPFSMALISEIIDEKDFAEKR